MRPLKDPPPKEIPAKRKRDHRGAALAQAVAGDSSSTLVPAKSRCPSEYTFGKLNVREFVQRLHAVGFADARVEGGDDGSEYTIIHLVSLARPFLHLEMYVVAFFIVLFLFDSLYPLHLQASETLSLSLTHNNKLSSRLLSPFCHSCTR